MAAYTEYRAPIEGKIKTQVTQGPTDERRAVDSSSGPREKSDCGAPLRITPPPLIPLDISVITIFARISS